MIVLSSAKKIFGVSDGLGLILNTDYFLILSSNENNLIYLRSSEWGKHDKKQQISSSGVVLSFVF